MIRSPENELSAPLESRNCSSNEEEGFIGVSQSWSRDVFIDRVRSDEIEAKESFGLLTNDSGQSGEEKGERKSVDGHAQVGCGVEGVGVLNTALLEQNIGDVTISDQNVKVATVSNFGLKQQQQQKLRPEVFLQCLTPPLPDHTPIGDRLKLREKEWESFVKDEFVLKVIKEGLAVEWTPEGPPSRDLRNFMVYQGQLLPALQESVLKMVLLDAVEEVSPMWGDGVYYSCLFPVAQDDQVRPIWNGKELKDFVVHRSFMLTRIGDIAASVTHQSYSTTADISKAYWHVPLSKKDRDRFRFAVRFGNRNIHFRFKVMPFGLSSAARVWCRVIAAALQPLRSSAVNVVHYMDDLRIQAPSKAEAERCHAMVIGWLNHLGLKLNAKKMRGTASKETEFVGIVWDSEKMQARFSAKKIRKLRQQARRVLRLDKEGRLTRRRLAQFVGRCIWARHAISGAAWWSRALVAAAALATRYGVPWSTTLSLTRSARKELYWWIENASEANGVELLQRPVDAQVEVDASPSAFGGTVWIAVDLETKNRVLADKVPDALLTSLQRELGERTASITNTKIPKQLQLPKLPEGTEWLAWAFSVRWTEHERQNLSNNGRELQGAVFGWQILLKIAARLQLDKPRHIRFLVDNMTARSYLHKGGGLQASLNLLVRPLVRWALENVVQITAVHVPGEEHKLADQRSRPGSEMQEHDYSLNPRLFEALEQAVGRKVDVDLMATRHSRQVSAFVSRWMEPEAITMDVFTYRVASNTLNYVFPPFRMMSPVIAWIRQQQQEEESAAFLVIAPLWPNQQWFAQLLQLADKMWLLPRDPRVFLQPPQSRTQPSKAMGTTLWKMAAFHLKPRGVTKDSCDMPPVGFITLNNCL